MSETETRERLTDEEREAIFRAGQHHPDTCDCSAYVIDQAFAEDDCCTALNETFETVERIIAARDAAARAEVAALHEFLDSFGVNVGDEDDEWWRGYRQAQREAIMRIRDFRAAPVGSSREAESGERRDPADYGPSDDRNADPEETTCRTCGHVAVEHTEGRYSIYGVCPAPVSSGGQADGEDVPEQPDGISTDGSRMPDPQRAAERILAYVSEMGDGLYSTVGGYPPVPLYGRDLESVARAAVAARPVLSREALVRAWDEGYVARLGDTPRYKSPAEWGNPYREADVLTAGGAA